MRAHEKICFQSFTVKFLNAKVWNVLGCFYLLDALQILFVYLYNKFWGKWKHKIIIECNATEPFKSSWHSSHFWRINMSIAFSLRPSKQLCVKHFVHHYCPRRRPLFCIELTKIEVNYCFFCELDAMALTWQCHILRRPRFQWCLRARIFFTVM